DTYLRHGGISQRQRANLNGALSTRVRGYDATLDNFDLSFLDNDVWDSNVSGNLLLPFPPDISIRLINMGFGSTGCVIDGKIPPGEGDKRLRYWQVAAHLKAVEFRSDGH